MNKNIYLSILLFCSVFPAIANPVELSSTPSVEFSKKKDEIDELRVRVESLESQLLKINAKAQSTTLSESIDVVTKKEQSEDERNAYALGQLMSIDALDTLMYMEYLDITLGKEQLTQGFMDGIRQESLIDKQKLIITYQHLKDKARGKLEEQEKIARAKISDITRKSNTLEKDNNSVWIGIKKGQKSVAKNALINATYSISVVGGEILESEENKKIKFDNLLSDFLHKGIKLAGVGGRVDMYTLASRMGERYPLPSNVRAYDILHFTIEVHD